VVGYELVRAFRAVGWADEGSPSIAIDALRRLSASYELIVDGPHLLAAGEGPGDDFEAVFLHVDAGFEDQAALGDDLQREAFGALLGRGGVGFLCVFFVGFAEGNVDEACYGGQTVLSFSHHFEANPDSK
jgi:hypothetical protein